jgi:hypothetical protein
VFIDCFFLLFFFSFFPIFLSLRFSPLVLYIYIYIYIYISISPLLFHTNSTSSVENNYVHGILGTSLRPVCPQCLLWIATFKFLPFNTPLASFVRLHRTTSFSLSFLPYIFSLFFFFSSKIPKFFLLPYKCFMFHSFPKNCICL